MTAADSGIVNSFIQLSNYFAVNFDIPCETITTLTELWEKHGSMVAKLIGCDRQTFQSSGIFYEVLYRKIRLVNAEMAAALDPKKAEEGDVFEISKFYALCLEYLRKDFSALLTEVLEKLATQTGFNSSIILEMFAFFDNLYAEDTVDNWWECLRSENITNVLDGLSTPKRNFNANVFATPTATARRLRTAASTARRSPIAEAVDSPTMKFLRTERELKQMKKKLSDVEQTVEDLDADNELLVKTNRELKLRIDELKGNAAGNRDSAENAEKYAEELRVQLESKQTEVAALTQQLDESRTLIRSDHRLLEELEAEKEKLLTKLETVCHDRDVCMKQMRDLRSTNEQEFSSWRRQEQVLIEQLRTAAEEKAELSEQLVAIEYTNTGLVAENQRLTRELEDLNLVASRSTKDAENAQTLLKKVQEQYQEQIQKLQEGRDERMRMSETTIERLEKELEAERNDKKNLQSLLNELNDKALMNDKENHGKNEGFLSLRACLVTAKQRIEHLEMEVQSKETSNVIQNQQMARMAEVIRTEEQIRNKITSQFAEKRALLEEDLANKLKELTELQCQLRTFKETYEKEATENKAKLEEKEYIIDEIRRKNEKLQEQTNILKAENFYHQERLKIYDDEVQSQNALEIRSSSTDSLCELLEKENAEETEEEILRQVAATPRKSVAFSIENNGDMTFKGNPLGFRTDMNNPRQSICSINEELFDRDSITRSSIRSDTLTLASAHSSSGFKTPYTPSGTSKDRLNVLTARNEKVKPHLQCSYASEMGNVSSPSADEENVKKGSTMKVKKSRRESLASVFAAPFKKN